MNLPDSQLSNPVTEFECTILPKPKKCGVLNSLSASQQEQLLDWLEIYPAKTVLEMVAAPAPDGFGIKTHLTSLRRFHMRAQAHLQKDLADGHGEVMAELGSDSSALSRLTDAALRQFANELSTVQKRDPAHFATVSRWVLRLQQHAQRDRELKLHQDRLDLERYKFEYSASRAALNYLPELNEIMEKHPGDNEDKIWAARAKLFPPRSDLIENPNLKPVPVSAEPAHANSPNLEPAK